MATGSPMQGPELTPLVALNRLTEMATAFMVTHTFATACNLGIFEQIAKAPATAEELAKSVGVHLSGCRRLLAAIEELGLVERDSGCYKNSALGAFLTAKSPVPLEPLSMWGAPWPHMWEFLGDTLRELSPRWQQALGTTAEETFHALYEDPVRLRRFTELMDAYSIPEGREVAKQFDFSPYRCVMDVAGGPGGFSIEIGKAHPHLRGFILDLPQIRPIAEERIRAAGLERRFQTVVGDLFKGPYPSGADVITLGWILHDWSDESCLKILRNCHDALPARGALLVNEVVLNEDHSGTRFGVLLSLHMAVVCEPGARERSEAEYRSLLDDAGFSDIEIVRYGGMRDLVVARKK